MTDQDIQSALAFTRRQIQANETYLLQPRRAPESQATIEQVMRHWRTIETALAERLSR